MTAKKFTLIGRALTNEELAAIPVSARFSNQQSAAWNELSPTDLINDDAFHSLDRLTLLMMSSLRVQCPVGPHDDPGLDLVVLRACNIAAAGSVAVQCSQGHWAEYPCGK
ncbi:MAG TPA: hypothetical protein VGD64_02000 [Acidisarcina sp.]